jgi:serine/threonine-protein kinase
MSPEKSIAVLPFENLSKDEESAFFTDGVQDEILADLAKVADLKVISRTSVMLYTSGERRNLREIGRQLGVAHLLEGSVQRSANRVRVMAQLVDARTDGHLWAQTYDRDLADVFAIQSEIAQAIADQLQAKISPREKAAISQPPTTDLEANKLYVQAKEFDSTTQASDEKQNLLKATGLLEEAVARDPRFVLAYCVASRIHSYLYFGGWDHTPARRELARVAIENASRIEPEAGEVHLARADYLYHGFMDYDGARAELDLARRTLTNEPKVYFMSALIDRRQGRWSEAVRNFERAVELDPRNMKFLIIGGGMYHYLRRYPEATRMLDRAVAVSPHDYLARIGRASQPLHERGDIRPLRTELNAILAEEPAAAEKIADFLFVCATRERDSAATARALTTIPSEGLGDDRNNFQSPREWFVGLAARTFGDAAKARSAFTAARAIQEKVVRDQPDYAAAWSQLGVIDAGLGRKDDAVREGRRACELLPPSKDSVAGPSFVTNLAIIYAWTGDKDSALEQLAISAQLPFGVNYGELKLDPQFDPLRGDPRFEKVVASLAPK